MSYIDQPRDAGEGQVRIGKSMTFREDMYNICFVSMVEKLYIDHCEEAKAD